MFRRLIIEAMRRLRRREGSPVLPALDTRPAPMRPLRPPAAVNDNPLAGLEAEVERDLRFHGYLPDPTRSRTR